MREKGLRAALPPNPASYITDWLFDCGPVVSGGMGMARLEWQDIRAWLEIAGLTLEPWEGRLIRRLSGEYLSMSLDAKDEACPAPFVDLKVVEANRGTVVQIASKEAELRRKAAEFLKEKRKGNRR